MEVAVENQTVESILSKDAALSAALSVSVWVVSGGYAKGEPVKHNGQWCFSKVDSNNNEPQDIAGENAYWFVYDNYAKFLKDLFASQL